MKKLTQWLVNTVSHTHTHTHTTQTKQTQTDNNKYFLLKASYRTTKLFKQTLSKQTVAIPKITSVKSVTKNETVPSLLAKWSGNKLSHVSSPKKVKIFPASFSWVIRLSSDSALVPKLSKTSTNPGMVPEVIACNSARLKKCVHGVWSSHNSRFQQSFYVLLYTKHVYTYMFSFSFGHLLKCTQI